MRTMTHPPYTTCGLLLILVCQLAQSYRLNEAGRRFKIFIILFKRFEAQLLAASGSFSNPGYLVVAVLLIEWTKLPLTIQSVLPF